jgi:hypothetical protein
MATAVRGRSGTILAALTLLVVAPVFGEVLSTATAPRDLLTPWNLALMVGMYGCGALLCREVARRYELGWPGAPPARCRVRRVRGGAGRQVLVRPRLLGRDRCRRLQRRVARQRAARRPSDRLPHRRQHRRGDRRGRTPVSCGAGVLGDVGQPQPVRGARRRSRGSPGRRGPAAGPAAGAACSVLRSRQRDDLETRVRSQSLRRLARQARALTADAKTLEGDLQRLTADTSRSSSRSPGSARSSPGLRGAKERTPASRTSQ